MIVLIDGEAVREDISDDDLERLAIASAVGETPDAMAEITDYLVNVARDFLTSDAESTVDRLSIYSAIVEEFAEWLGKLDEDEKKKLAEKIADAA
jgi:hypothetical protein